MWKNYIIIALRHFQRDARATLINITGLSVGFTAFFLIMLWVNYQLSFDKMHENRERIYRVMSDRSQPDRAAIADNTPYPLGDVLKDNSGISRVARMMGQERILVSSENFKQEQLIHYVDPSFLQMFTFPLINTTSENPLKDPFSIVMTESAYRQYFGDRPLNGQTVNMKSWGMDYDLKVTAVIQDPPDNSSIRFDYLLPMSLMLKGQEWLSSWGTASLVTYVQLHEGRDAALISEQIKEIPGDHHSWDYEIYLFPLSKVHLYNVFYDRAGTGRIIYVYIFSVAAFLILVLACINFMNLSTAQAARRAREIGIRKTMGAVSYNIRLQVFVEGILMACFSALIAVSFIQLILPVYNNLLDTRFETSWISGMHLLFLLFVAVITGLLSASYPAMVFARFNPVNVLKSTFSSSTRLHWSKQTLLVFQLSISVIMICAAVIVIRQVEFLNNTNIGFARDNLFYFPVHENGAYGYNERLDRELKSNPSIQHVTFLSQNPLQVYQTSGDPVWEGKDPDQAYPPFSFIDSDYDVEKVLNLEMLEGRAFSREFAPDSTGYLINEKAAAIIGPDAVGKSMEFWGREGTILGVFRDFHHLSLHNEIQPMIIRHWRGNTSLVFIRFQGEAEPAIAHARKVYDTYEADYPFTYHFVDEQYGLLYRAEKQVKTLTIIFAGLVILVAVLGLYGIVAYVLQGQYKMIGIRKVMGATTSGMIMLFLARFSRWVFLAVALAIPAGYFLMSGWLENFAYRIDIRLWDLVIVVLAILLITLATVWSLVWRAACVNPASTLKSD